MSEDEIYELSLEEIVAINEGLTQLDSGQWITNEDSNKRADEWLTSNSRKNSKKPKL